MKVLGSLTPADPLHLGEAVDELLRAGVDGIHVDLADGGFVPHLQGSVELVAAVALVSPVPVWAHLMVAEPEPRLLELRGTGATGVLVHLEAAAYPWRLRALAGRLGLSFGLALNPATPLGDLEPVAGAAQVVSLLTTEPDDAGERFLPGMTARVQGARSLLGGRAELEVDGGVDAIVAARLRGVADRVVAGRAVLAAGDPARAVAALREAVLGAA